MMTPAQIAADVAKIRSRERRDDVLDPKPVTTPWKPMPPVAVKANPDSTNRGHRGSPCKGCKGAKPIGGWAAACPRGDVREFKGG